MSNEVTNAVASEVFYETLDGIGDDLHALVRLLNKPEVCMSAPEVLDVVRLAGNDVSRRVTELAYRMRAEVA